MPDNRRVIIASLPDDALQPSDFKLEVGNVPEPGDGQVLCRTLALTIGAGQRAGLQGSASYAGAPEAGRVMGGTGFARVEASGDPSIATGSLVTAMTGWQDYSLHDTRHVTPSATTDPGLALGVLGTNALTAYVGRLDLGRPQPGETDVLSAA